jgi:hypothetical protein
VKIPYGGKAIAIFGLILITIFWVGTTQRIYAELAEAQSSEFSKNANLALALDVQTNQLLNGLDHFLLLIKDQYEGSTDRIELRRIVAPVFSSLSSITFVGVTNEYGDVIESLQEFSPTNVIDREFFKAHQQADSKRLLISSPVLGRVSGRWAITLTRRINKRDGSFGGLAAISIEPRYLTQLFETTSLGPSDVMSLVLTNGITLARRRGEAISFGEDISGAPLMVEARARPSGTYMGPGGLDGQLRLFAYRTMQSYPVITTVGTETTEDWEGCLSIPDLRGRVPRAREIVVRALDRRGKPFEMGLKNFPARVVQHETDHLDGVLFLERMESLHTLSFLDEFQRYSTGRDE